LGREAIWCCRWRKAFRRNSSLPSSGLKWECCYIGRLQGRCYITLLWRCFIPW
jgi:hypothetical protein